MAALRNLRLACVGVFAGVGAASGQTCDQLAVHDGGLQQYGIVMARSGDQVFVGAPAADTASIYQTDAPDWTLTQQFFEPSSNLGCAFGVDGDTLLIGAWADDDMGGNAGAAFVYGWDGAQWVQTGKLFGSQTTADDWFGYGVAILGDTAVVGAPRDNYAGEDSAGTATIFVRSGASWIQQTRIASPSPQSGRQFGYKTALRQNTAFIAEPGRIRSLGSGGVHVYRRSGGQWSLDTTIEPPVDQYASSFGVNFVLEGPWLFVDERGIDDHGAVHCFETVGGIWEYRQKIESPSGESLTGFGWGLAANGGVLAIGARFENDIDGRVYLYTLEQGVWAHAASFDSPFPEFERFGEGVLLTGSSLLASVRESVVGVGHIVEFSLGCLGCPADFNGDGTVNTGDVLAFLNAWAAGDPRADVNGDGSVNTLDVLEFLTLWNAGCN